MLTNTRLLVMTAGEIPNASWFHTDRGTYRARFRPTRRSPQAPAPTVVKTEEPKAEAQAPVVVPAMETKAERIAPVKKPVVAAPLPLTADRIRERFAAATNKKTEMFELLKDVGYNGRLSTEARKPLFDAIAECVRVHFVRDCTTKAALDEAEADARETVEHALVVIGVLPKPVPATTKATTPVRPATAGPVHFTPMAPLTRERKLDEVKVATKTHLPSSKELESVTGSCQELLNMLTVDHGYDTATLFDDSIELGLFDPAHRDAIAKLRADNTLRKEMLEKRRVEGIVGAFAKKLRGETGAHIDECRRAIRDANGDVDAARVALSAKAKPKAEPVSDGKKNKKDKGEGKKGTKKGR